MARPTKYKPEYCDALLDALGNGKSVSQFAAMTGVSRSTVYYWAEHNPEFSDALTRGQELSEAFWETELQGMMYMRDVNAPLVKLYFANRFGWHDKQAVDHTTGGKSINRIERVVVDAKPNDTD